MDQEDFSERAAANDGLDDEIGESDVLVQLGVDKGRAMVASRRQFVILIRCAAAGLSGRRVGKWLVEVLVAQAVALGRDLVLPCLRVVLRSAVALQFPRHSEHGQVLVHQMEETRLYLLKHIVTELANESIIVLSTHMYYEFIVVCLSTLR